MRSIDLNLLRSLDVLLEERHVTRAARRLGLSQPALSAQLARLRDLLGDPLLVSAGRQLVLTQRAQELQTELRSHLTALAGLVLRGTGFDASVARVDFRIACSDLIQRVVGVALARDLLDAAPGCRLALMQPIRDRMVQDLETGAVNLVLAPRGWMVPDLRHETLYRETFVTVVHKAHPLAGRALSLKQYCAGRHVIVSTRGGHFSGMADTALGKEGKSRRVVLSVQDFMLVPSLLQGTDLIATVPMGLAKHFSDDFVVARPPMPFQGYAVEMAWHPVMEDQPPLVWLRERVRDVSARLQ